MAFYDTTWYLNAGNQSTTGYYAVAKRPQNTAVVAGQLCRQFTAPGETNERVFVCIIAGTTANVTDATWVITRGAKTVDGTATWMEISGMAAVNSDITNTVNWTAAKAIGVPTQGAIIKRANAASYWICTTAGTMGASEPAWPNDTAGTTQADGTTTWTCLGVVANFTKGAAPHARFKNVYGTNWFASGNTIYIGDNHAESSVSVAESMNNANTTTMSRMICHNHTGNYPPAAGDIMTGAVVGLAVGASNGMTFNATGTFYFYGIVFGNWGINISPGGSSGAPDNMYYFDVCSFSVASGKQTVIGHVSGNSGTVVIWNNCTVKFASTADYISMGLCSFVWRNTVAVLVSGSSVPTTLIGLGPNLGNKHLSVVLEALDLNQITTCVVGNLSTISVSMGNVVIRDCKLNASATFGPVYGTGLTIQTFRSDSAATAYKSARYQYEGTETTETTITRVGGAVDPTGQAQSRKIVTSANSVWLLPFNAEPYAIWNPTTAANVTVTVCGTINAGVLPNNDDIWMEIEYLGSATFPIGTIVTTTKAQDWSSNALVTSDGSTWNGGGSGAGWSPFKLVAVLSSPQPAMAGYINARVRAAKPSATYYIDPQVALS